MKEFKISIAIVYRKIVYFAGVLQIGLQHVAKITFLPLSKRL